MAKNEGLNDHTGGSASSGAAHGTRSVPEKVFSTNRLPPLPKAEPSGYAPPPTEISIPQAGFIRVIVLWRPAGDGVVAHESPDQLGCYTRMIFYKRSD